MPDYPSTLPFPKAEEYSFTRGMGVSAVTFEHGNTRQRINSSRPYFYLNLTFAFTTAQLGTWQLWANRYGYDWHTLNLTGKTFLSSTAYIPTTLRYVSDITIEPLSAGHFRVSVTAETA